MRRWPPKWDCLREAFVGIKLNKKSGRKAKHYKCAMCGKAFPQNQVQVDHISPVVPASGFTTWDKFIERLFCEKDNLQVLCKACHKKKTKKDRK